MAVVALAAWRSGGRAVALSAALPTLVTLLTARPPDRPTAQSAEPALRRAQAAYDRLTTLRATFVQTIENPMLGGPEVTRGTLWLAPPDRFAMRFTEPAGDRIVADGEWLWAYTPSTVPGQVIRQPIPRAGALTPDLFRQFVDRPLERYEATYIGPDSVAREPVDVVRLVPRVDMPFTSATIAISRRTGLLRWVALLEDSRQKRTLVLTDLTPGAAVPPDEVRFEVPRGVKIVTP